MSGPFGITGAGPDLYDRIGRTYTGTRRPDPRIAAAIWDALGDARTVLNVGAGAGAYEPPDRDVGMLGDEERLESALLGDPGEPRKRDASEGRKDGEADPHVSQCGHRFVY